MKEEKEGIFTKSTTIITIILAILGGAGILITPQNKNFIIMGIATAIIVIIFIEKFNQIDQNREDIIDLQDRLDMEKRLNNLEKEMYEQKGKLSMIGGKNVNEKRTSR